MPCLHGNGRVARRTDDLSVTKELSQQSLLRPLCMRPDGRQFLVHAWAMLCDALVAITYFLLWSQRAACKYRGFFLIYCYGGS